MMKRILIVGGVLLALLAVPLRAEIIEQVLVKVNGDILTKTEFEQRQIRHPAHPAGARERDRRRAPMLQQARSPKSPRS